jgi:PhzF family phenazine biosynthesis protein
MDFPSVPPREAPAPPGLLEGLGAKALFVGRNRLDWIVQLESEEAVRRVNPDQTLLAKVPTRGIIITAKSSTAGYDFVSRAYFPLLGVPEDPVCGSAHCCLGPFWQERLGKDDLVAHQVSKRGGVVYVRCAGERVMLGGKAVTAVRGELTI